MTCIAGIAYEGKVYIGGERGASDDNTVIVSKKPKVYTRDGWAYGFAGTYGTGQLLDIINLPTSYNDLYNAIRLNIVEELKRAIESFGRDEEECNTDWIIGKDGRLFELSTVDWGVCEVEETSIGSGNTFALGSLYTTRRVQDQEKRLRLAIKSAIEYSPTCTGPVDIVVV